MTINIAANRHFVNHFADLSYDFFHNSQSSRIVTAIPKALNCGFVTLGRQRLIRTADT